jgi:hypothetical protein
MMNENEEEIIAELTYPEQALFRHLKKTGRVHTCHENCADLICVATRVLRELVWFRTAFPTKEKVKSERKK